MTSEPASAAGDAMPQLSEKKIEDFSQLIEGPHKSKHGQGEATSQQQPQRAANLRVNQIAAEDAMPQLSEKKK